MIVGHVENRKSRIFPRYFHRILGCGKLVRKLRNIQVFWSNFILNTKAYFEFTLDFTCG